MSTEATEATEATVDYIPPPFCWIVPLLDAQRFEDAVVLYVRETGRVGFPEFAELLDGHLPTTGNYALKVDANVLIWRGLSEELSALALALLRNCRLVLTATMSPWTHQGCLGLKRADFPLKRQYKHLCHLGADFELPERAERGSVIDPATIWIEEVASV